MAYGQHQSFYLRDRWLNKAIKHLLNDERFFYDKEAFEKIGLGKNMVQSLRYWVVATKAVEEQFNEDRKKVYLLTEFGKVLYKYDKFIQFNDSAAIIHYHLSHDKEPSTAWYWFFNIVNETVISKDDLIESFINWVEANEEKTISHRSLKRDIDCLIKLYTAGQNSDDPEEVIQSPINKLNLLQENKGVVFKRTPSIESIGITSLMYILLEYRKKSSIENVSVDEISNNVGLWGKLFNLNKSTIVDALERLSNHPKYSLSFIRTNNLDTVRIPEVDPIEFLEFEYKRKVEKLS